MALPQYATDRPEPAAPRPHVLVVDDEEDLCRLLTLRLEHHGFRVSTEQTARGGLEVLEREVVDAMIVDVRLEHENGLDLLVQVQNRSVDLPVVILTANGGVETAIEAMRRGAYGFVTKPFDDLDLLQKLDHAVERVRLRREVAGLRRLVGSAHHDHRLLGTSDAIADIRELIARVGPSDATVLLLGESGTGKEVAARCIHAQSSRASHPFVAINCGALPPELLESELFGHKRGSFTGALRDKDGLFHAADGGTLFLDEIGDAPPSVQVKLLRVLQERSYLPVGATEPAMVDVRIIAATNRDLQAEVLAGSFREDLFYRLHVVPISMPPLRERTEDIPLLAELFLTRATAKHGLGAAHISSEALQILMTHSWPGNVRELANVVEGAALLTTDAVLRPEHVRTVLPQRAEDSLVEFRPRGVERPPQEALSILGSNGNFPRMRQARDAFDRLYLQEALRRSGGNVSAAAKLAGRNRTDFHDLLRRHGIDATQFRP
ncbi:sigma-54-dependent transcriptional regulator [Paraliomyxa miuraensis]|uniref:sigma-54-dependent transcriptional regulator n=1 Tax=Paraliomyxa miuraensis TaxID=376150 RepID=UPI00224E3392|nr:sigma-54 dependent transcriptional regulator [Paraliomyxa miuraensis]MCX4240655.1 sigma-54 dependent transcriptional regulator [Paraliomyxa miuraensis]